MGEITTLVVHKATDGLGLIKALCQSGAYQLHESWEYVTCVECLKLKTNKHKFKYYMHNDYQFDEILEHLGYEGVPSEIVEDVAIAVKNEFYELVFNCEYDADTGNLTVDVVG